MSEQTIPGAKTGELLALWLGLAAIALAGTSDVAAGIAGWLCGEHFHLAGSRTVVADALRAFAKPSDPARAWSPPGTAAFPPGLYWAVLAALLVVIAGSAYLMHRFIGSHPVFDTAGTRGNDGFASTHAVKRHASLGAARHKAPQTRPSLAGRRLRPDQVGYPLGVSRRPGGIALYASPEESTLVIGPAGSGKTLRIADAIIRHHDGPMLVTTANKPDLYEITAAARSLVGEVLALDPEGIVPAAKPVLWSPLSGCADTLVAERRAAALIGASGANADMRSGTFFRLSATEYLYVLLHAGGHRDCSMRDVLAWLDRPTDPAPQHLLERECRCGADVAALIERHTSVAAEMTSAVLRTASNALACFKHEAVMALACPPAGKAFSFPELFEKSATVYTLGKQRAASSVAPFLAAFAEELVTAAEEAALDRPTRRLDPSLRLVLDEAAYSALPSLPGLFADGRGRGVTAIAFFQSLSQAEQLYGRAGMQTLLNAASITAVMRGLMVMDDLSDLAALSGTRKVVR